MQQVSQGVRCFRIAQSRHLPNPKVDGDGTIELELMVKELTLEAGNEFSLLDEDGSAIVIHEGPDDYQTDPAGNSGTRIACGELNG